MRAVAWNKALFPNLGTSWGSPIRLVLGTRVLGLERRLRRLPAARHGPDRRDAGLQPFANKLVWASQSRTTNPSKVGPVIHELSRKIGDEMEKQGLLGDPANVSAVGF